MAPHSEVLAARIDDLIPHQATDTLDRRDAVHDADYGENMSSTDDAVADNDNQAATQNGAPPSSLGLSRRDTTVTLALGGVIFVLLIVHWIRLGYSSDTSVTIERSGEYRYQVSLNESGWVEWAQLEGIGEALARRIVEDRAENGPFADIDDLQRVRGIGPKKVEAMRPWITCPECPSEEAP